jgi:hypothetical protein
MTPVSILFLRTAILMLVAGIAIGAAGLAEPSWMTHERSVTHTHLLLVGWLLNTVIGVAWWMFPRVPGTVAPARVVVGGWAALNAGLLLRVVVDLFGGGMPDAHASVRWSSAALQTGGIVLLAVLLWRRVRGPSSRQRVQPPEI